MATQPALAVLLWLLAGAATAADRSPVDALLGELDEIRAQAGVAGFGLILVDGDRIDYSGARGIADLGTGEPLSDDHVIRIGSITKAFTGLGMLVAQRQSLIDLDAPIDPDRFDAPLFLNPWPDRPVTLARLLEHTAGLKDMSGREFDFNDPVPLAQALAVDPDSRVLAWPAGLHSSYSNSGAGVAAHVFEVLTGRGFEAYVAEHVFAPLAMTSATFRPEPVVIGALAAGYDSDGRTPIPYWHQLYRPFGAINVRMSEMAGFLRMLVNDGRLGDRQVFTLEEIHRMETPRTGLAAEAGLDFGYGLGNYAYVHEGFVFHGHGGDADGYLSFYGYSRTLRRGYFVLINAYQNRTLRRMRATIEDFLVRGATPEFEPPVPQPAPALAALAGSYRQVTSRFGRPQSSLDVVFADNRLRLVRGNRSQVLLPMGDGHFRRRFEPVATIAFVHHEDTLYLQGPFGNYARLED